MAEVMTVPSLSNPAEQARTARYWAFISYSQRDLKWGQWLIRALETYRLPKQLVGKETSDGVVPKRLAPVFRDRDELSGAADLGEKIREAVEQSRTLIVICSPNSAHSEWVNKEVIAFKSSGRGSRVLTLIVDGEPNAADAKHECFPLAVRYQVDRSGVVTAEAAEPLAAARFHKLAPVSAFPTVTSHRPSGLSANTSIGFSPHPTQFLRHWPRIDGAPLRPR